MYRGYYIAARGYEIYLRELLKMISSHVGIKIIFFHVGYVVGIPLTFI